MKRLFNSLLTVVVLSLSIGCTDNQVEKDAKQFEKTETINESDTNKDKYIQSSVPFKISEVRSVILSVNDPALETPLRGVRYEISLFSEEKISNEDRASFIFEISANSFLKESLGHPSSLHLIDTGYEGGHYTLSFETMYGDYSEEELEELNKERNFQIYLNYKGVSKEIEIS